MLKSNILNKRFMFQPAVCSGFHDVLMTSADINNISMINIYGVEYRCVICRISKIKVINLLRNSDLIEKMDHYDKFIFIAYRKEDKKRNYNVWRYCN